MDEGDAEPTPRGRPLRRCAACGGMTRGTPTVAHHVAVIEGSGGAISTSSEDRLEFLCGWCGKQLGSSRPYQPEDTNPL